MLRTLIFSNTSSHAAVTGEGSSKQTQISSEMTKTEGSYRRIDTEFTSKGCRCVAWLYLPEGAKNPPVVGMAHGLGGERKYRLDAYADCFAAALSSKLKATVVTGDPEFKKLSHEVTICWIP